jgi:hypothetical protein
LPSAAERGTVEASQVRDLGERDVRDVAREHRTRAGRVGEVLVSWGKLTREKNTVEE